MATIGDFDPLNSAVPATKIEITNISVEILVPLSYSKHPVMHPFMRTMFSMVISPCFVQDFLGQIFCTLGEIIGSSGGRLERMLSPQGRPAPATRAPAGIPGKKCGIIIFTAEELSNCRDIATMQFCANKLDKKDFFGKSDPFLVFYRSNEDGTFTICHKTEVIKNNLNPVWQSFTIPVRALCNVYFIDGNPSQPTSLHYMSPYQMNTYAMALKAVGEIIQDYDSDKLFPAYGFGAKLPPDGKISHAFPLNSNTENPNCEGIEGVLEAYFHTLRTVQLYGPTNFAPVINQVARCAADVTDGSQYFVLLMITDGVISDMAQTKEAVVNAASLPMSIIIVGVGPAEFDAMEELDGDEVRVSSRGRFAERDIVQFVPFRDYMDRSGNQILSMARLAKDVLAEIPDQLMSFMKSRGIEPRPPLPANTDPPSVSTTSGTPALAAKQSITHP
uniref:Copine family member 9 n=1 Tax=Fundulus heteroclitus TaxID=8078 RepID=A0A3Q2TJ41_FUNHE